MRRADRRRGRRHPDRDLPGPAADQGRGQRRQTGARRRPERYADLRSGHGRDHRHAAGRRRHRRRGDNRPRARCAGDRSQLRHRAAGDGRARQMARRELAGLYLGAAQCRAAGAGGGPYPLPARGRRIGAMAGALRRRRRRQPDRRLLRHRRRAHRGARRDAAPHRRAGGDGRPGPRRARVSRLDAIARLALRPSAAAPGERLAVDRRALQRQRLAQIPPIAGDGRLGRLRRDGARAGQGRLARARFLHRVCRPRRDRRDQRGGDPDAPRGQRAAGDRLHRISGDRSGAQAAWRQADHQLDQFRGRRGGRRPSGCAWRSGSAPR